MPAVPNWLAANELPDVFAETAVLVLQLEKLTGVTYRRVDFQLVADNAGVGEQLGNPPGREAGNFAGVEVGERLAVSRAFLEDSQPTQPGLGTLQGEKLELYSVIPRRHAQLPIVVGLH